MTKLPWPEYLEHVRGLPCVVNVGCRGAVIAHHWRKGTDGGIGRKPSDMFVLPLCLKHHTEVHSAGEISFAEKYGFSPFYLMMWQLYGFITQSANAA